MGLDAGRFTTGFFSTIFLVLVFGGFANKGLSPLLYTWISETAPGRGLSFHRRPLKMAHQRETLTQNENLLFIFCQYKVLKGKVEVN